MREIVSPLVGFRSPFLNNRGLGGFNLLTPALITATRAGATATYFDSNGALQIAPANTLRFDHRPDTRAFRGLLVEPAATNLAIRSAEFNNVAWLKTNATITAGVNDGVGGTTAFTLLATPSAGQIQRTETVVSGSPYVTSVLARRRTGSGQVFIRCGDNINHLVTLPATNWNLLQASNTPTTTTGRTGLGLDTAGDEVDLRFAQLEAGTVATSYIPNVGAVQNTRNADNYLISGAAFTSIWPGAEGTIYSEFEVRSIAAAANRTIFDVSNVAGTERIHAFIETTGAVRWEVTAGGSTTVSQSPGSVILGVNKFAAAFKANDCQCALNGVASAVDASATIPTGADAMGIGATRGGTLHLNGWKKTARIIPRRLSETSIISLTD